MKTNSLILLLSMAMIFLSSCDEEKTNRIQLSNTQISQLDLSSASGIEYYDGNFYVVGDDTPWLYIFDKKLNIIDKVQVSNIDSVVSGRVPKKIKADFECIGYCSYNETDKLVIISSGSMLGSRDTAYLVDLNNPEHIISKNIRPLFEELKKISKLPENNEINIEGLVFSDDFAFMLHRGNVSENYIFKMQLIEFINYLDKGIEIPAIEVYQFELPEYKGVPSGFSGACLHPNKLGIIYTASMEDTKDEVNDGKVLGSYIGYIPIFSMKHGSHISELLVHEGQVIEKKLESICIIDEENRKWTDTKAMKSVVVSDNDDGTSDIIEFELKIR